MLSHDFSFLCMLSVGAAILALCMSSVYVPRNFATSLFMHIRCLCILHLVSYLYTYAAVVFYLLYICFGMEEGTFLELLCMYLFVYLRVRTSIYILGICVSFLASYMCTVGQGLDRKQEYIIYSGFIQIDTLGGGHIMEDIARREWPVSL